MRLSPAVEWYRLGSRRPEPVTGVKLMLSSGERWRGLRVDLVDVTGPGELPEGSLKEHALVGHIDGPARTDIWYAGEQRSGDCMPGDVCVVPAGMPYAVRRHGPGRIVIASAGTQLIERVAGDERSGRGVDLEPVFCARDPLITQLLLALMNEVLTDNPGGPLYAETLGASLAAQLLRKHGAAPPAPSRRGGLARRTLEAVIDHLEARLADPVPLNELADVAGMSTYQLVRRFKKSTGLPPHQYVVRRRIERAKVLLRNKELTVLEVALSCGFSSQSHFAGAFRLITGLTPRSYRSSV